MLSQRWHPDRHPDDRDARVIAEKKQRAINLAMHTISEYYKQHGCMPLRARPKLHQPDTPVSAAEDLNENETVFQKGERQRFGGWPLFIVAPLVVFTIWLSWPASKEELPMVSEVQVDSVRANLDIGLGKNASQAELFGFGDAPEVVRFIQGEPTSVKDNSWFFGKSVVYFKNGRVSGWLNDIETPLRTTSMPDTISKRTIRLGSSSQEVAHIQGEPLFKSATRWDYGPSYIEFRQNRVSGWHNSPMRPLRVEE